MDLQEKRQLEVASQMARAMRARARPWRSIIALVLAMAAAAVTMTFRQEFKGWAQADHLTPKAVTAAGAVTFCALAVAAMLGLSGRARDVLQPVTGRSHASVVRYTIVLAGSIAILVLTLDLVKAPIGQLVVGGALTTILIGIAAQQSLANVFAGIVLLLSRPFSVGDRIRLRSGSLGGILEGTVIEIGITYLRLETADGVLWLPNSQVLASGVGTLRQSRDAAPPPGNGGSGRGPVAPDTDRGGTAPGTS